MLLQNKIYTILSCKWWPTGHYSPFQKNLRILKKEVAYNLCEQTVEQSVYGWTIWTCGRGESGWSVRHKHPISEMNQVAHAKVHTGHRCSSVLEILRQTLSTCSGILGNQDVKVGKNCLAFSNYCVDQTYHTFCSNILTKNHVSSNNIVQE
jgi:hypothetical protein